MADLPAHTARAMILRRLPRALRAGLDPEAARGPLAVQLVADADAVSPGIGHALALWVNENVGSCAGLGRWLAAPSGSASLADGALAELERLSALTDDATLREIAEALVLCGSFDRVAPLAGQAASASWAYLDRLLEVGADLHQLSLASRDVQEPYPSLQPPWPNLDDIDLPAPVAVEAAIQAWHKGIEGAFSQIRLDIHHLAIGLSVIAGGRPVRTYSVDTLGQTAIDVGRAAVETLTRAATQEALDQADRRHRRELEAALRRQEPAKAPEKPDPPLVEAEIPPLHVLVCPTPPPTGAGKGKDVIRGYEHAIGQALPLALMPDVAPVARALLSEFPYARDAVEAVLGGFAGRPHVHAPPMLLVGSPGSGKTRFVRRLGEALGVGVYRVDGANDSGGSFGGTERRWHSSEPCRPFMAIARHRQANPLMLVDELDKASTRADYGRLWDSMLQALDPENATNFPDPSLQVEVDISWVTVICTANGTSSLPGPLLDRLRIVRFPEPGAEHLGALLPGILDGLAREAGVDPRFHYPIDGVELAALSTRWRGGSIRRLRRAVEAILRVRERAQRREAH